MIDGRTTDDNCIAMKLQNLQKLQKLAGIIKEKYCQVCRDPE